MLAKATSLKKEKPTSISTQDVINNRKAKCKSKCKQQYLGHNKEFK